MISKQIPVNQKIYSDCQRTNNDWLNSSKRPFKSKKDELADQSNNYPINSCTEDQSDFSRQGKTI